MDRSYKQKFKKTVTLNDTVDKIDAIDIFSVLHLKLQDIQFFQVHIKHFPGETTSCKAVKQAFTTALL